MNHEELGEVMTPYGAARVWRGTYLREDGPTAVWLDSQDDGQRIADLSINLEDSHPLPPPNHFWVPRWKLSPRLLAAVEEFPRFEDTGQRTRVGPWAVSAELWRIVP